jgi:5-methylthioadenosine/S-adenosylhomocysteine deaminase
MIRRLTVFKAVARHYRLREPASAIADPWFWPPSERHPTCRSVPLPAGVIAQDVSNGQYHDPTVMPAWEVLRMATIEGARAIGLGEEIGSLEVGKQADLILVGLSALNLSPVLEAPVRNVVPNLVYAASGHEVKTVMVAGKVLVRDGVVLTADEDAIRAEAQAQAEAVARLVAADPVHKGMALLAAMEAGRL